MNEIGVVSTAVTVDPRVDQDWMTLVRNHDSDVFHSPRWLRAISKTYQFDVKGTMVIRGTDPVAGLPYAVLDGMGGPRVAALPFSDFCDPIVSSDADWQRVVSGVVEENLPISVRCVHNLVPLADERFQVVNQARWQGIDLWPEGDDPWAQLDASARRAIRRSQRDEVHVSVADSPVDLRTFHELHMGIRKHKYRLLAQPYAFFENLWDEFVQTGNGALMLARVNGEVAAGVLFLEWKDTLYYKFNASDPRFSDSRPNDAIMWAGIEYGRARRLRRIDLGLSDWDQDGLIRYKRKYASEEKTISFLSYVPPGASNPAPSPLAKLMPRLTHLLTDERIPDAITERAGAVLYRFLA